MWKKIQIMKRYPVMNAGSSVGFTLHHFSMKIQTLGHTLTQNFTRLFQGFPLKSGGGFTLVEMILVISIMSLIMGLVTFNYGTARNQRSLAAQSQRLVVDLRRVQNMAMNTAVIPSDGGSEIPYGYGMYFNQNSSSYIIFADRNNNRIYDSSASPTEKFEEIKLDNSIEIASFSPINTSDNSLNIFFSPPDPITFLAPSGSLAQITLRIKGGACPQDCRIIDVGTAGYIGEE